MTLTEKNLKQKANFQRLVESAVGQEEVVGSIRQVAQTLQKFASRLTETKTDNLLKTINRTKIEFGIKQADEIQNKVFPMIDDIVNQLIEAHDQLIDLTFVLSGDISNIQKAVNDLEGEGEEEVEVSDEETTPEGVEADEETIDLDAIPDESEREMK